MGGHDLQVFGVAAAGLPILFDAEVIDSQGTSISDPRQEDLVCVCHAHDGQDVHVPTVSDVVSIDDFVVLVW